MRAARRAALTATAAGGLVLLAFYGTLIPPGRVLFARDVALFHLPLKADLVRLAEHGLPSWNPWLHGGQPVLSNPSYAAFYPPTWLAAAVAPHHALDLLVLLHAALAFAGAWRLARRFGAGVGAAALAGIGFAGGGTFVSLTEALSLFFGAAWLPWLLLAGEGTLAAGRRGWLGPAAAAGAVLALLALNGEPATTLCGGIALAALAGDHWLRSGLGSRWPAFGSRALRPLRLAVPAVLAAALAAVQVVPTLARLADSPRAGGLEYAVASVWSARPARLLELLFPHLLGDPGRVAQGLFFGTFLHDRDVPYVATLYPGLAVTVLALAGLAAGLPRRGLWALLAAAGVALGLGRFNPLHPLLHEHVPWLGSVRFPEKFLLLVGLALPVAAALSWQRLAAARANDGERRFASLALAIAAAVAAVAAGWWGFLLLAPERVGALVREHAPSPLTAEGVARGVSHLTGAAATAVAIALALAGLLLLVRARRLPPAAASALAAALLLADLAAAHAGLVRTAPAAEVTQPPPLARLLAERPGRLFSDGAFTSGRVLVLAGDDPEIGQLRNQVATLEPASGNLWGFAYALDEDYDLMLTRWGRHGLAVAGAAHAEPEHLAAVLAAWDVGTAIRRRPVEERIADVRAGRPSPPVRVESVAGRLPRFRGVPAVSFHRTPAAAVAALAAQGYAVARRDHWVGEPPPRSVGEGPSGGADEPPPANVVGLPPGVPPGAARVRAVAAAGSRIEVAYEAPPAGGFLTAAVTFDSGWRGSVGGRPVPLHPTALGQIGAVLPAGPGRLVLVYRDPWVPVGAALSALALAGLLAIALRRRWWPHRLRRAAAGRPPAVRT